MQDDNTDILQLIDRAERLEFFGSNIGLHKLSAKLGKLNSRPANEHLKTVAAHPESYRCAILHTMPNLIYFDCLSFVCICNDGPHDQNENMLFFAFRQGSYWPHAATANMKNLKHFRQALTLTDEHVKKIIEARGEQLESVCLICDANGDTSKLLQASCPNLRSLSIEPDILLHLIDVTFDKLEEIHIRCHNIDPFRSLKHGERLTALTAFMQFLLNHDNLKRIILVGYSKRWFSQDNVIIRDEPVDIPVEFVTVIFQYAKRYAHRKITVAIGCTDREVISLCPPNVKLFKAFDNKCAHDQIESSQNELELCRQFLLSELNYRA